MELPVEIVKFQTFSKQYLLKFEELIIFKKKSSSLTFFWKEVIFGKLIHQVRYE